MRSPFFEYTCDKLTGAKATLMLPHVTHYRWNHLSSTLSVSLTDGDSPVHLKGLAESLRFTTALEAYYNVG
jgi:hypothetical protein